MGKNIKPLGGLVKYFFILIAGIFLINSVSATDIQTWQGKYLTGSANTVYTFNFTVYDDVIVGTSCWTNTVDLTTDSDRWWFTEQIGVLASCNDSSQNYYLNIEINGADQVPRRLLKDLKYADTSVVVSFNENVNMINDLQIIGTIFGGSKLKIGNDTAITGNLNLTGNISNADYLNANFFVGAGIFLINLPTDMAVIKYQNISNIPTCGAGQHLDFDGTTLSCTADEGSFTNTNLAYVNETNNFTVNQNFTGNLSASWYKGIFNWIIGAGVSTSYLTFNGTDLIFDESQLNITIDDRASGLGDNATWNQSFADTLYILQSSEGNLNVNSSDFWDNYNTPAGFLWISGFNATGDTRWLTSYTETDPLWAGNTSTVARAGDCPDGQLVMNTTTSGVECLVPTLSESDPLWSGNQSLVYLKSNLFGFVNTSTASNLNYRLLLYWANITNRPTYLGNFTDNILWTSGFNTTFDSRDSDTIYSASGLLLDLTGTTFSVNNGTLTNAKGCKFVTGTGIVCDQDYLTSYTESDPLWSGNKTDVAFKNEANVFTAGQSLTGQNITAINCIIFDSGGKICSGV